MKWIKKHVNETMAIVTFSLAMLAGYFGHAETVVFLIFVTTLILALD